VRLAPVLLVGLLQGLLVLQVGSSAPTRGTAGPGEELSLTADAVLARSVRAGERVVLAVRTTGLVDVTVYESTGDAAELQLFRGGGTPRTAKQFHSVLEVSYPLASLSGTDFWVRVQHRRPGRTSVFYRAGTQDEAMGRLPKGQNLVRNQATVVVAGRLSTAVYQLVPGTLLRVQVRSGKGTVALLKTRDYLDVKDSRASLASRCTPAACVETSTGRTVLELYGGGLRRPVPGGGRRRSRGHLPGGGYPGGPQLHLELHVGGYPCG
jgi:hypothetical protein